MVKIVTIYLAVNHIEVVNYNKLQKMGKKNRANNRKNKSVRNFEPELVNSLLNEILDIVKNITSDFKANNKYDYRNIGSKLFSKIFELGLYYSDFKRYKEYLKSEDEIYRVYNQIIELLAENPDWLSNFFDFFPLFYFAWGNDPKTAYMIRSGIQILLDFWKELLIKPSNNKLNTILLDGIKFVDDILKRWIENPENWLIEKPNCIPNSHWWYTNSGKNPKSDQRIELDLFGRLIISDPY
jgi:hypothetical protein